MPVAFVMDPSQGIFRAVKNGDNAMAPSTPSNVIFDAYGNKVHGMSFSGQAPFSAFSGPINFSTGNSQVVSSQYWIYTVNFPEALPYVPLATFTFQNSNGVWSPTYQSGTTSLSGSGSGGITFTNEHGTSAAGIGFVTTTSVNLFLVKIDYANATSYTPFQAASYRVFGV